MPKIKIYEPGLLTTVQDLGRFGYQQFGMPVSGAMDTYSLKLANFLVGNNLNEAGLEATATGPEIEFDSETQIAICGADMQPNINGNIVEMNRTIPVRKGDRLTFQGLTNGFRSYIAFAGGIDVPSIMGSKSTYLRGEIGGFFGRSLKAGDEVQIGGCPKTIQLKKVTKAQNPALKDHLIARVVAGPEASYFTLNGLASFLNSDFILSNQCDRMGYRLEGGKIDYKLTPDIISSGIAFGTVQVPAHGEPIIMMADRQTTGGYARIANIISADLPILAQLQPEDRIGFQEVSLEQAFKLLKAQDRLWKHLTLSGH